MHVKRSPLGAALVVFLPFAAPVSGAEERDRFEVRGRVLSLDGSPLAAVAVGADAGRPATETDGQGGFRLALAGGDHLLRFRRTGYEPATRPVAIAADTDLGPIVLRPLPRLSEEVIVQAIRAEERIPVTKKDLGREELEAMHYGQEMPFLLKETPSITHYSETGLGAGYSYFSLRGIHQTRINMTLDGVPLNDPEESAVYFANFGDFTSALGSIQIQRGVGTSTVGAASYGGSINFASAELAGRPDLNAQLGGGSFGSARATLGAQTGRVGGGLSLSGRASLLTTDGFRQRSGVRQRTVFLGAAHQGSRSFFKAFAFSGRERTELAFLAVEKAVLERDLRFNPMAPEEKDRFGQDFAQAQFTRALGSSSSVSAQVYYNGAQGWFRLWDDPIARTVLNQYAIDGHFVGALLTFRRTANRLTLTGGTHYSHFTRDHFLDVVGGARAYTNTGFKDEANAFAKAEYALGAWLIYADAQLRRAEFRYQGDLDLAPVDWTFLNPKLGVRRTFSKRLTAYASVGKATREPTRNDLLSGEDNATVRHDLRAVRPERVLDFEAGVGWRGARFAADVNLYAMEFHNEIAATGQLSEIGLLLRRNVDQSHRRGLEMDATYQPVPSLRLKLAANLSRNRIREWTQFYDVYDESGALLEQVGRIHREVRPLLTPEVVLHPSVEWLAASSWSLGLSGRYVSRAFLDNTNQPGFDTPAFVNLDASASFSLARWVKKGHPRLRLQVNNVLDNRREWPSGYSYLFLSRTAGGQTTIEGIPYYYPLARRSLFLTLDLRR